MRIATQIVLVSVVLLECGPSLAVEHTKDSLATVRKNLDSDKAVLIDVREQDEWDEGRLKHATLVPLSQLKDAAERDNAKAVKGKLPKKKIVYCHCRSGGRALVAGKILAKWGFDVRPLKHGYEDLVEAGFPRAK
ncbi:MAG: rhodanese-like domain-containing protein [Pirellulales bacterium]|nr:rhodanese-like domain-containing protein [Pirellulales bacterium]